MRQYTQTLIIGSGLAGCTAALVIADQGHEVTLVNVDPDLGGGNSSLAQGGIIYKSANDDDSAGLAQDILVAGRRYNSRKAVRALCHKGPHIVEHMLLERVSVPFDRAPDGTFDLTREGGHSVPRILHCADHTGRAIMQALTAAVRTHPRIQVRPGLCIDLLTSRHHAHSAAYRYHVENRCAGAYVFNLESNTPETLLADWTVLATGGVGQVFLHTTNAPTSVGSGVSMAHRAGVALTNLEFVQFHPTALYHKTSHRRPLITEALRGEGARLLDSKGHPFMRQHDPRGDLAPRDVVARALVEEMLRTGAPYLYLDVSSVAHDLPTRFPTVFQNCAEIGVDIRTEPIPVVPAAHYMCGGVLTDMRGRTDMHGLYAIGECACTGLHGANRLASTSLLEALTFGVSAGQDIARRCASGASLPARLHTAIPDWDPLGDEKNDDPALVAQDWVNIRHTMWNYVGISRSSARLKRAFEDLRDLSRHIHDFYRRTRVSPRLVDLFHGVHTAYVITQAALRNRQSLGCHYRVD